MKWLAIPALLLLLPEAVSAHPGGLNAQGCHNNRKTGDYHCHGAGNRRPAPERTRANRSREMLLADSTYYSSCAAARAAGVAPLRRGEPGYRPGLDRDDDGIACE